MESVCKCVSGHRPQPDSYEKHHIWPKEFGGPTVPANLITICGTTHNNVHVILREAVKRNAFPDKDWFTQNKFNRFTVKLAQDGFWRIQNQRLP